MAKKERTVASIGDTVELADKETSFFDPETRLDISRSGKAKLEGSVGRKTQTALLSGRLLVVGGKKKAAAEESDNNGSGDDYDIPADLPGREAFVAAGLTTFEAIKALDTEEKLLEVKGIGKGTVKALTEWAAANMPKE